MIRGVHAMLYSTQADELRAFIKDKLRLPHTDVGDGWLIFDFAEGDLGVHPTDGQPPSGTHHISFYCDDLQATVKDLASRGVRLDPVEDHGYGFVTHLTMPGGVRVQLYQPKYAKPKKPAAKKAARRPAAASKRATAKQRPAAKKKTKKAAAKKRR